ncbi:MAG TPA: hypothetical protein VGG48_11905 [Rhizomicrobium sp.]|jgi:hypothetical protein
MASLRGRPSVYVVTFVSAVTPKPVQILGVYASPEDAFEAVERARADPVFGGETDFFWVDEYEIGEDDWTDPTEPSETP